MIWNFYVNTCGCSRLIHLGLHFFFAFLGILLVLLYRKSFMPGPTRSYASDHLLELIWYMYVQHSEVKVHGFDACYVINVNFIHSCAFKRFVFLDCPRFDSVWVIVCKIFRRQVSPHFTHKHNTVVAFSGLEVVESTLSQVHCTFMLPTVHNRSLCSSGPVTIFETISK